ncbi:hypothetical protein B296_00034266 [Ensete ventricosum]|uniref:Uncharacterized protein n=1 Tax=Ensete ventricosum TaxID=4639 RepID=A0A427A918_ENSVE|nr:hypothetical protein B296_00034266 [Ensete ventricosum]
MTLLPLFFPHCSIVGHTDVAFRFSHALLCSNRALLCLFFLFFPLSQPHLYRNHTLLNFFRHPLHLWHRYPSLAIASPH